MSVKPQLVAALVVLALASGACGNDNVVNPKPEPQPPTYPILSNPYNVIDALVTAYVRRDTVEIKLLYDDGYQGASSDQTDPVPSLLAFTKADEVAHVAALAHASLTSISVLKSPSFTRYRDAGDPPGWASIDNPLQSLQISDATTTRAVDLAHETMQFKFIPHTPDPSSTTDTTWKIVRWIEVRN